MGIKSGEHGGHTHLSTVIRGREQGDQLTFCEELVAVFDDLMRSANKVHVVFGQESRDDVATERERDTTIVLAPTGDILVRVGPEEVTQQTGIGNIGRSHDPPDLFHALEVGTQTTVHGENLLVDDSSDREAVEAVGERLPQLDVIPSLA